MSVSIRSLTVILALAAAAVAAPAEARDQIRIVGSSTVYPFATVVAEEFGRTQQVQDADRREHRHRRRPQALLRRRRRRPPDIANASRRIKQSEVDLCAQNGVKEITEIKIGYDGIVIANAKSSPRYAAHAAQLFLALAKQVPRRAASWCRTRTRPGRTSTPRCRT